jgi:hypothetical protein
MIAMITSDRTVHLSPANNFSGTYSSKLGSTGHRLASDFDDAQEHGGNLVDRRKWSGGTPWRLPGNCAFTLSVPIASWQFLVLLFALRKDLIRWIATLILWLPVTSIGIAAMILPLWWWNASTLAGMPWIAFVPLVPGAAAMALLQRMLLRKLLDESFNWAAQTIIGVVLGATIGLVATFMVPAPIELTWAFVTVVGMCWPQGATLAKSLPD